jgi:hypothetical protein
MPQAQGSSSTASGATVDFAVVGQLAAALGALAAGWAALTPRFKRMNVLRRECGSFGTALWVLYRLPQGLNAFLMLLFMGVLVAATIGALETSGMVVLPAPSTPPTTFDLLLSLARALYSKGWLIVLLAGLFGMVIHFDVLARLFSAIARVFGLGRFGPSGESVGWHQARELLRNQGDAQLLWLDQRGVERVASAALREMVAAPLEGVDRAALPPGLSRSERANLLLFGCIIEQIYTNQGESGKWQWDMLYTVLADAHRSAKLFSPESICAVDHAQSFSQLLRKASNPILASRGAKAELSVDIDTDVDAAAAKLREKFAGDATRFATGLKGRLFGAVKAAHWNVSNFPRMGDDTMRPQFLKLCLRWDVFTDAKPGMFVQPFSSTLAWYLLNNSAIGVASDQKTVTFKGPLDRPLARIAAKAAVTQALTKIKSGKADDIVAIRARYQGEEPTRRDWLIQQEIDTTLFRLAREGERLGRASQWKNDWRWKLDDRVASRV